MLLQTGPVEIMAVFDTNQIRHLRRTKRASPVPGQHPRRDRLMHRSKLCLGHAFFALKRVGMQPGHGIKHAFEVADFFQRKAHRVGLGDRHGTVERNASLCALKDAAVGPSRGYGT